MQQLRKKLHTIINYSSTENVQYTLAIYFIYRYQGEYALSINKVMKDTLVSKSSILKFCKNLGYLSWKIFSADLERSCEKERLEIDSIRIDTGMLYTKQLDIEKHKKLYYKVWEEYHSLVGEEELLKCITYIDAAKRILLLGNLTEISMFSQLQSILVQYHKHLEFPKVLDVSSLEEQINTVDANTLVIYVDSTLSWSIVKERETMNDSYNIESVIRSGAKIIYIGQAEAAKETNEIYQIALPFSFNKNFTRLVLYEFISQLEHIYVHKH